MTFLSKNPLLLVLLLSSLLNACISFSAFAESDEQAKLSLQRLSKSLRQLNFNTSFVVVKNNQAEPYHWSHGISQNTDDNSPVELEVLALLNGPRRDVLRVGNTVSYIEPEYVPYSIISEQISGPIPTVFRKDTSALENNYHFVSVGRSRILGRAAQLIRIVPKNTERYGYWLWLDQQSGLMLKLAIITRKGKLLEQIQFTHLEITDTLSSNLLQLQQTDLPKVIDINSKKINTEHLWQVNWLPSGFNEVKSDRHRINNSKKTVEFKLFNDGLVDVSIYVNPSQDEQRPVEFAHDGATIVLNQVVHNIEVSVVGKIPLSTAKKIVASVSFTQN